MLTPVMRTGLLVGLASGGHSPRCVPVIVKRVAPVAFRNLLIDGDVQVWIRGLPRKYEMIPNSAPERIEI